MRIYNYKTKKGGNRQRYKTNFISAGFGREYVRNAPYNNLKSSFSKTGNDFKSVGIGICIKIATRKSNCSQGIGFRCGFIRNCHKLTVEKSEIVGLSRDRVQPVEITVNKKNREIILHFINKIDWKYLENN